MMDRFVTAMGRASLLCDLVDAETVGLENALRVIAAHPETDQVGIRVDSGDTAAQCVLYFSEMKKRGIKPRTIVFEDEVTPETVTKVYNHFRQATGEEPTMLFPGAGGYWWRLVHRDTVSAAFKRSATEDRPNVKFSNSPGKESLAGYLRVYGKDDTLIVADASESIDGEPLFVKLVDNGRIVYQESFQDQSARADRTWGRYKQYKLSPKVQEYKDKFQAMRDKEISAFKQKAQGVTP
jgi:nicotinic acid phosphoribosyltransferase